MYSRSYYHDYVIVIDNEIVIVVVINVVLFIVVVIVSHGSFVSSPRLRFYALLSAIYHCSPSNLCLITIVDFLAPISTQTRYRHHRRRRLLLCHRHHRRCTMVQSNQQSRRKYCTNRSSIRLFTSTTYSFACSAQLAALTHFVALIHSLSRSLPSSRGSK